MGGVENEYFKQYEDFMSQYTVRMCFNSLKPSQLSHVPVFFPSLQSIKGMCSKKDFNNDFIISCPCVMLSMKLDSYD